MPLLGYWNNFISQSAVLSYFNSRFQFWKTHVLFLKTFFLPFLFIYLFIFTSYWFVNTCMSYSSILKVQLTVITMFSYTVNLVLQKYSFKFDHPLALCWVKFNTHLT